MALGTSDWLTATQAARLLRLTEAEVLGLHEAGALRDVATSPLGPVFDPRKSSA